MGFLKLIPIKIWGLLGFLTLLLSVIWGISTYGGNLREARIALAQANEAIALHKKDVATRQKLTREFQAELVKVNKAHIKLKQKLSEALSHELTTECLGYRVSDYVEQLRKRARRANEGN